MRKDYLMAAMVICGLLFLYALYATVTDNAADQKLITKCNEHWREQVEVACPVLFESPGFVEYVGYEINISNNDSMLYRESIGGLNP